MPKLTIMTSLCFRHRSCGLATLELVLSLPILLFVMALIMGYGTAACWKVRALTVARHELWGSRWPRTGNTNPRPSYWPASASVNASGLDNATELDDRRVDQPVARGPLPRVIVDRDLLDHTRGFRKGAAGLTRDYPLLAKMGPYHLDANTRMLDDKWQYQRMRLSNNWERRVPILYTLAKAPASMASAYVRAARAVLNAPFRSQLRPLDRDDEFTRYRGSAPDFHPYLQRFCDLDRQLADETVRNTIDRIQGRTERNAEGRVTLHIPSVAETMARAFLALYEGVIQRNEALIHARPSPSPAQMAALQAEIAQFQGKVAALNQFLDSLRQ
jgi:hypothetical protein